ncbi:uncharacterized protein P884DRAFT_237743 [Thermothelomyces heterothallicus CBS 202.75]|uniref:uncharacterized protein n=1 Tax=Thermothelomyces heterothallicus CBS 202.75 TaxID=1149848 RepID=UPI0037439A7C
MQIYGENGVSGDAAADWSAWASVPWTAVFAPSTDAGSVNGNVNGKVDGADVPIIGWLKSGVPYLPPEKAASLQTLDVWIPNLQPTATEPTAPDPSSLPLDPRGGDGSSSSSSSSTWIIYIHGGAWRDPRISSASFAPAATDLLLRAARTRASCGTPKLAGVVSLNYRLSPHPSYPPSPSPSGPNPSRQARHPDHIADVLAGLAFLRRRLLLPDDRGDDDDRDGHGGENASAGRWILAGHSCGATLAFQSVMDPSRWGLPAGAGTEKDDAILPPAAIVGFNGLYDLAGFIASPPAGYAHLREAYRGFVTAAFGPDRPVGGGGKGGGGGGGGGGKGTVWTAVCPATAEGSWAEEEERKGVVVLVQSREDTLVPWQQLEVMRERLERERRRVEVRVLEGVGDHDDVWREGDRMAEVLWELAEEL